MIVKTEDYNFGPYLRVEVQDDRLHCIVAEGVPEVEATDDAPAVPAIPERADDLPFRSIGEYTISADDSQANVPPAPRRSKAEVQAEIDQIERDTLENRGAREIHMRLIEREAADKSTATGIPAATILAAVPYYVRLVAINAQIAVLRTELASAP